MIGANIMLDYDVVFDISARRVGFARSVCGKDATPFCCGGECSSASTKLLPAQGLRGAHAAAGSVAVATATANVEQVRFCFRFRSNMTGLFTYFNSIIIISFCTGGRGGKASRAAAEERCDGVGRQRPRIHCQLADLHGRRTGPRGGGHVRPQANPLGSVGGF